YLIDMQRDTIEHPDYIPESRRGADLRAGADRGRIYRIVPRRGLPRRRPPLAELSSVALVAELGSESRWRRDTAQRLLYERGGAPGEALRAMALDTAGEALARLHALWTLEGAGAIDEDVVLAALSDPDAGVRENALQIAERHLPGSSELRGRMVALADDPAVRVRFQAALGLGGLEHPERRAGLERILRRDARHRWSRLAVESALGADAAAMLIDLLGDGARFEEAEIVSGELADLVGAGLDRDGLGALSTALELALQPAALQLRAATLDGLASGLARAPRPPAGSAAIGVVLDRVMKEGPTPIARSAWLVRRSLRLGDGPAQQRILAQAAARTRDRSLPTEDRAGAVDLLALGPHQAVAGDLVALLAAGEPSEVEARAIRALAGFEDAALGRTLVELFRGLGPGARGVAIGVLLRRPVFHGYLVAALEEGRLTAGELHLDLEQRRRLLRSDAPGVAARAAKLIHDDDYGGRAAVVEDWLDRLPAQGSSERGSAIHQRLCAQCHLAAGIGHAVGPDFGSLAHRGVEDLVSNILDPDHAIHPDYVAYEVVLVSGDRELGLIEHESSSALTLLQAGGERRVIPRQQVASRASTGHSLMPAGLEQGLDPQALRDLIALIHQPTASGVGP
ncbi:MAG TPA: HEAT repeat domain-containing protein, partial [Thermoanaerobaculia bacterium]|nr:HEAT repeat domain-containing protein [Thermoanaerobaculia bacterium]